MSSKKSHAKPSHESDVSFIRKLNQDVNPTMGISGESLQAVDSVLAQNFRRIFGKAMELCKQNGSKSKKAERRTVSDNEIATAVKLVFPLKLAEQLTAEGARGAEAFAESVKKDEETCPPKKRQKLSKAKPADG